MADVLSCLKCLDLYDSQDPEPVGQEFSHTILENLPPVTISTVKAEYKPIEAKDCDTAEIIQHRSTDYLCIFIKDNLSLPKHSEYKIENGILYRKTRIRDVLYDTVVVPGKIQGKVLLAAHENLGHMGINKTYAFLRQ